MAANWSVGPLLSGDCAACRACFWPPFFPTSMLLYPSPRCCEQEEKRINNHVNGSMPPAPKGHASILPTKFYAQFSKKVPLNRTPIPLRRRRKLTICFEQAKGVNPPPPILKKYQLYKIQHTGSCAISLSRGATFIQMSSLTWPASRPISGAAVPCAVPHVYMRVLSDVVRYNVCVGACKEHVVHTVCIHEVKRMWWYMTFKRM